MVKKIEKRTKNVTDEVVYELFVNLTPNYLLYKVDYKADSNFYLHGIRGMHTRVF